MADLIRTDLFKMLKSGLIKILFFSSILSATLMLLFSHLIATGKLDMQSAGFASLFADSQIFTLLGCIMIGMFFCNDFEYKIIENAISSGHPRETIVVSKLIVLALLTGILAIPYIGTLIVSVISNLELSVYIPTAFLNIINLATTGTNVLTIIILIVVAISVYTAQLSIGIFIMFKVKKPVIVVALSYVVLVLLGPILSNNNVTKEIMAYTPYGIDYTQLVSNLNFGTLIKPVVISIIFVGVITILSILVFRKAEIK